MTPAGSIRSYPWDICTANTGVRSRTAITSPSGHDLDTVADATSLIASTRRSTALVSTRSSGVPVGTSAAAITADTDTRCVPVT